MQERREKNEILGGAASRHRVGITNWSLIMPRSQDGLDETTKSFRGSFRELCHFLRSKGYECIEMTIADLRFGGYYPDYLGDDHVVCAVQAACAQTGLQVIGSLLHITDGGPPLGPSSYTGLDFNSPTFWQQLKKVLSREKLIGSEYATFQIDLPVHHKGTGGAYRSDDAYLRLSAERVHGMQQVCFELGLNFYVETHVDRISEDPEAFCKIFDYCPSYFEVNADISHYLYRNIHRGAHFERIMERVGHTHQRMARKHGDLSSDVGVHMDTIGKVGDPVTDWDAKGVTWQAMQAMSPALQKGLSSRVIIGESGPALAVPDALELDTKLVPLWRAMAKVADGDAQKIEVNPWK